MKNLTKKGIWFFLVAIFIIVQQLSAQGSHKYADKIKIFEDFVKKQMEIDRIPGLSIGFMKDDFVWTKGFGYAELENKTPATASSAYRLASVTKPMTAVAVLQLLEKGKIDLDAEVQKYVPYFPRKRWPITVRQLLGHLGGISHYKDYDVEGHIKMHKDTREAIAIFENFDLAAEPGTKYNYSSYGYNLLGAVIEGAAKQSYGDYMRENIWGPLGMNNTHMDSPDEIIPGRVKGYRLIDGEIKHSEFIDISSRFAAGGTRSTVIDLLKFAKGIIDGKLLSQQTMDQMFTSMATKEGRSTNYGMGLGIGPVNGRFCVNHSGGQAETRTWLLIFPRENFAIAAGCNFEHGNPRLYAARLYQLLFDEPWNMPVYTGDRIDDAILFGMQEVFNFGLSYFERYQKPLINDEKELAKVFFQFNKFVNPEAISIDYKNTTQKIREGRHPVAKEAFIKIGSFMAMKLQEKYGSEHFEAYHKIGSIAFFNDYIEMYSSITNYPKELQFNQGFVQAVKQFQKDWNKTFDKYTQRLIITPHSDWDALKKKLKKTFDGAKIYPDFSRNLARVIEYYYINGDKEKASKAADLAIDLYPNSAVPYVLLANAHICFGERDEAKKLYKKASEANVGKRDISAQGFVNYAYNLVNFGKINEALELLKIGIEIHPEEAVLCHYLGMGYHEMAKRYYKKALELDPQFEDARRMLKKIQQ